MEPINPQEPVSQDLMKQMESIQQTPPVPPVTPPVPQSTASSGMNYAGFWRRFLASLIDSILVAIVLSILGMILAGMIVGYRSPIEAGNGLNNDPFNPLGLIGYIYNIFMIGKSGQTLGKKWLGIRVVTKDGGQVSWSQAIIREIFKIVSGLAILLGYLWMIWDKDRQTWHDKVAKTYVINVK